MINIILSYIGVFVLFVLIVYAIIWAILGLKAYLNWYRDEHSELYLYEVSVKHSYSDLTFTHRYFANSESMALRKYNAEFGIDEGSTLSVRLVRKYD